MLELRLELGTMPRPKLYCRSIVMAPTSSSQILVWHELAEGEDWDRAQALLTSLVEPQPRKTDRLDPVTPICGTFDTKYYNVSLEFQVHSICKPRNTPEEVYALAEFEAVVVLLNGMNYANADQVSQRVNPFFHQTPDVETKLVMLMHKPSSIEEVFDFDMKYEILSFENHARFREALECTMWRHMGRKTTTEEEEEPLMRKDTRMTLDDDHDSSFKCLERDNTLDDDDDDLTSFEDMFKQVAQIKAQMHLVSDAERRQHASDLILKLAREWGVQDSDSD